MMAALAASTAACAAAGSDFIKNAGTQPPVKPAKCVREHERHDQDPRPPDSYVQGPAQIEAADTTDQHVASGDIEQAPYKESRTAPSREASKFQNFCDRFIRSRGGLTNDPLPSRETHTHCRHSGLLH